jgi:hypothetical protein
MPFAPHSSPLVVASILLALYRSEGLSSAPRKGEGVPVAPGYCWIDFSGATWEGRMLAALCQLRVPAFH